MVIQIPNIIQTNIKSDISLDEQMSLILRFIYCQGDISYISSKLNENNSFDILSLTNTLGMESLSFNLGRFIKKNFLNKDNCLKILGDSLIVKFIL